MKKQHVVLGLTALLAIGSLGVAQNKKTITLGVFPDLDSVAKAALPGFLKTHPNLDVKIVTLAYADHHNALQTALATGSGANDVEALDFGYVAKFAEGAGMTDLAKAPFNAGQLKNKFTDYTFPQATTDDGRIVAIPTDIGPGTMFYRRGILAKMGIKPEQLTKSWEDYIALGKKIKAAMPNVYLVAHANNLAYILLRTGLKPGEGLYFDENGKSLVDSPRFVKAFTIAKEVRDAKLDAKVGEWSNEWYELFKRGTVATQFSGAWMIGHLQNWMAPDTKGDWGVQQLPEGAYASWGGSFYGIPAQSKNKAEAWELIKYLTTNAQVQVQAFKVTGAFPALKVAQLDPMFNDSLPFLNGQKGRLVWRQAASKIKPYAVNRYDSIADEIVNQALSKVLDEGTPISDALAEAKSLIEHRVRK
ncbi:MAG TPA: extracellular solute-binding protein [Deinococcales bacterium]|nr:extracellular solute-binding protein [Deinococcales bacterium]